MLAKIILYLLLKFLQSLLELFQTTVVTQLLDSLHISSLSFLPSAIGQTCPRQGPFPQPRSQDEEETWGRPDTYSHWHMENEKQIFAVLSH